MPGFRSTSFVEPDDVRQLPGADLRVVDLDEVAVGLARSARGWHRRVFIVIFIALSAIAMAACGGSAASPAVQKVDASKAVGMLDSRVVVDVRTAAEYAAGHIAGAKKIDVEAADFSSSYSTLDKTAAYLVYCHSAGGVRSLLNRWRLLASPTR